MSKDDMNDDDDGRACNLPSVPLPEETNFLSLIGGTRYIDVHNVIDLYQFIHLIQGKEKRTKGTRYIMIAPDVISRCKASYDAHTPL